MGNKEKLEQLINELLMFHESGAELALWREVFDCLTETEQIQILDELNNEVRQLRNGK